MRAPPTLFHSGWRSRSRAAGSPPLFGSEIAAQAVEHLARLLEIDFLRERLHVAGQRVERDAAERRRSFAAWLIGGQRRIQSCSCV